MKGLASVLVLLGLAMATALPAAAEERAIVVLDGSGSMWGQIGGKPKIAIAREVLRETLGNVSPDLSLGLMAYGHRRKGDCGDIEMIVPFGAESSAAIAEAAERISPVGKTPLSDAVRQAAETLKYAEDKATVILVTDGIETCRADPCALARELEGIGVDLTVHVVGFGLSAEEGREVACLAEETGGLYIKADDAGALGDALADTVEAAAAVPEPAPQPSSEEKVELPAAAIEAPDSVEIGSRFEVTWQGPGEQYDAIQIHEASARGGRGERLHDRRLRNGAFEEKKVSLVAPARPGAYELQYYFRRGGTTIATRPIEVVDAEVSVLAPATVEIGRKFTVEWKGPGGQRDTVDIIDPTGNQGAGKALRSTRLVNGSFDGRTVELVAPAESGFYRLRYWNGDNSAELATREIEVLDAEVSLMAPETVAIGLPIRMAWVGPGGFRDTVQVFDRGAGPNGRILAEKRLVNDDFDNRRVTLPAPATPGSYLLRYWNGDNSMVLATRQITIEEAEVSLTAPDEVKMAHHFEVSWVGPGAQRDAIELFDPDSNAGRGNVLKSARIVNGDYDGRKVKLDAVHTPGTYQLRYYNGDSGKVMATRPVEVVATEVSLEGPESSAPEATFQVTWQGPGAFRDAVEIFDPAAGAGKGKVVASKRLVNDDYDNRTVRLKAPKAAGAYILRYWNGDNSAVLGEAPLTVR